MTRRYAIDTGPLVALLDEKDAYHAWAAAQIKQHRAPFFTCEAVLSEAFHLLEMIPAGCAQLLNLLERDFLNLAFTAEDQLPALVRLLRQYADQPMSWADACLVRMTELDEHSGVFTLDADFRIYRKNSRQVIPLLIPPSA